MSTNPFSKFVELSLSGCWEWIGSRRAGYGRVRYRGRHWNAHRASYDNFKGPIPEGMFVCHACDNPACVNPDHLWLGTHKQNMADMARKGRAATDIKCKLGERNPAAKLTKAQVAEIRLLRGTLKQREIAALFGVSKSQIGLIHRGKNWAWASSQLDDCTTPPTP
jgi:hypothetical protein